MELPVETPTVLLDFLWDQCRPDGLMESPVGYLIVDRLLTLWSP